MIALNHEQNWITTSDGQELLLYKWFKKDQTPVAIIQIAHGMAEHMGRYQDFARFLVENDIFVFGNDHRGHGKTGVKSAQLGFFAKEHGFERVTDDLYEITLLIKEQYPETPIFLCGHSMGSFLMRRYIQKYSEPLAGVILSGTAGDPGILGGIGLWIARREKKTKGVTAPSPFLNKLIFGNYNRKIKNPKTAFDWLTREESVVQEYIADPLCGYICTTSFYEDLLSGLRLIHRPEELAKTPAAIPLFIFSGAEDPVGSYGKGIVQVINQYEQNGNPVTWKIYPGGRHEMLNEKNRHEVFADILEWINRQMEFLNQDVQDL